MNGAKSVVFSDPKATFCGTSRRSPRRQLTRSQGVRQPEFAEFPRFGAHGQSSRAVSLGANRQGPVAARRRVTLRIGPGRSFKTRSAWLPIRNRHAAWARATARVRQLSPVRERVTALARGPVFARGLAETQRRALYPLGSQTSSYGRHRSSGDAGTTVSTKGLAGRSAVYRERSTAARNSTENIQSGDVVRNITKWPTHNISNK